MKCPFYIKVSSVCKRLLVASESNFYKKKDGKYGLTSRCKECQIEKSKDRQRECKEEISKYKKHYVEKNKDKYNLIVLFIIFICITIPFIFSIFNPFIYFIQSFFAKI